MLQLFETFCAVAETGSLSKAAEAVHITQPAVTRHIKALEQELGAVLLTRTTHGVALTPVGEQVLVHARQALAAVAAAHRVAAELSPGDHGRLAIAAGNMLTQFIIPPVIAALRAQRPELQVEMYAGNYQDCLDRLTAYQVDLALISTPNIPPGLKARKLFIDPVVLVAAPKSPLAGRESVRIADLEGKTLLVLPKATGLRQQLVKRLTDAAVNCHLVEHPTVETLKTIVSLDMGVTLLPRSAVAEEVAQGRLSAILVEDWPDNGRPVLAVTRGEGSLSEPVQTFLKALQERYGSKK